MFTHHTVRASCHGSNFRVLTAIAYLNDDDWTVADGGALRCYAAPSTAPTSPSGSTLASASASARAGGPSPCVLEVVPRGGTVVVFPSCDVPHEVLPSRRPRIAATLWFVSGTLLQPGAPTPAGDTAADAAHDGAAASGSGASSACAHTATWTVSTSAAAAASSAAGAEGGAGFTFGF